MGAREGNVSRMEEGKGSSFYSAAVIRPLCLKRTSFLENTLSYISNSKHTPICYEIILEIRLGLVLTTDLNLRKCLYN